MKQKPVLYIKSGCPWCVAALDFFQQHGVALEVRDVRQDAAARARMEEISGQTKTPTLEYGDFLVADFSVEEFCAALRQAPPAIRQELGLEKI